jgi:hypothetical protein
VKIVVKLLKKTLSVLSEIDSHDQWKRVIYFNSPRNTVDRRPGTFESIINLEIGHFREKK